MVNVVIPVFSGVEELDVIGPLEVFGLARQRGLPVEVALATHEPGGSVRGVHGAVFAELAGFSESTRADVIVVPGGAWLSGGDGGARRAVRENILPRILSHHFSLGSTLASVCTGAFLLEAAGLLTGVPATTHHLAMDDLRAHGVTCPGGRVVDAGQIITSGGIASGIDLALHLLDRHFGESEAIGVAELMEYQK